MPQQLASELGQAPQRKVVQTETLQHLTVELVSFDVCDREDKRVGVERDADEFPEC